jgi:NitT/TauT family transport system permease protein
MTIALDAPAVRAAPARRAPWVQSERFLQVVVPLVVGLVLLAAWEIVCRAWAVPEYLVPAPTRIAETLVADAGLLFGSLWVTLRITFFAFVLATVLGTAIAFAFAQSRWIELGFFPYAVLLQVTPVAAVAPLIIIWCKDTTLALTLCATLVALFPIIANTTLGLRSVPPGLAALFRMQRATRGQTLLRLQIPSALPYWFAGLRISSGLSLIGAVVAEFVAGTGGQGAGLAYQILQAGFQIDIARLFAALALISLTGVLLFWGMLVATHLALGAWHESMVRQER